MIFVNVFFIVRDHLDEYTDKCGLNSLTNQIRITTTASRPLNIQGVFTRLVNTPTNAKRHETRSPIPEPPNP